jgi:hypothetical protein
MSYITSDMAQRALDSMQKFHEDIKNVFALHSMDLLDNLGRRNCILSQSQETFLAIELGKVYSNVISDGAPGQPDIVIGSLGKELECKLTTRNKSGQISFQTDYETLRSKGSLDYIYFVASADFEEFAVLHFENLTIDDFRPPANGSRGRSQMIKSSSMRKCNVLVGSVRDNSEINLEQLRDKKRSAINTFRLRGENLKRRINLCSKSAPKRLQSLKRTLGRERGLNAKKIKKLQDRIQYWEKSPKNYSIVLEKLS